MKKINKIEYAKVLAERLKNMLETNEASKKEYENLIKTYPVLKEYNYDATYWSFRNKLTPRQERIYLNEGEPYKKSDFKRCRIELNKVLLEIEKDEEFD